MFLCLSCEPAQVWDLKDAGLQAASRVAAASDPLGLLAEISQNFLSLVSSLTRAKVPAGCCSPHSSCCCCCCRQRACHTPHRPTKHAATYHGCVCPGSILSRPRQLLALKFTRPVAAAVCRCTTLAQVSDRLRTTVRNNQQYVNPGANFMLLNGMLVEVKNFEIYSKCSTAQCAYSCTALLNCLQEHDCAALLQVAVRPIGYQHVLSATLHAGSAAGCLGGGV